MFQKLNSIKVITINTCSLRSEAKKVHLHNLIKKHKPNFVLTQETHFTSFHKINMDNFVCYRNDKSDISPGTAIFCHKSLKVTNLRVPIFSNIGATFIKVNLCNNESLLIGSVYFNCNMIVNDILNDLNVLSNFSNNFTYSIIGGDFNGKHTSWNNLTNNNQGKTIFNWLNDTNNHHFFNLIFPTDHTRPISSSTLDFYIISDTISNMLPQIRNFIITTDDFASDHRAVVLDLKLTSFLNIFIKETLPLLKTDWEQYFDYFNDNFDVDIPINSN